MMENKKNSLLIVDDEVVNIQILTNILGQDYTIFTAQSGENAIKKALECHPDLILLDILMPGMNGYKTLYEIKNNNEIKKTPVVFITALDTEEDEERGLSLDASDYITKPFNPSIVRLRVRNQIQIVNQMRTIQHLSMVDQLTNISNRRSFDERMDMEWKQALRDQAPISLLMMDLDRFKKINDTYGHLQGDVVLQKVAEIFKQCFKRPYDFLARWGGEEFVVLMPNTPSDGALEVAERIRGEIEAARIPILGEPNLAITISIGVATVIPSQESSPDKLILMADKALYAAKDAGRNKVISVFVK
ncbi:MAG: diguanylate cyclase [Treponema sp.]|nr:diguanylate cyclase [Treponema sp.]